jgi:hypothetical protein
MPDAAPADPCSYREAMDPSNGDAVEPTSLTLSTSLSLCGQIDVRPPSGATNLIDRDQYSMAVDAVTHLVTVETTEPVERVFLQVTDENGFFDHAYAQGRRVTMILPPWVGPGEMQIQISAYNPTELAAPVPYTVTIEPLDFARCPTKANADYVEASDGASNLDNDMALVTLTGAFWVSQTTETTDVPEMPPLTIGTGTSLRLDGQLGINTTHADIYKDRDVYALPIDASTQSLDLRLAGSGDSDLDILLINAATSETTPVVRLAGGNSGNSLSPELQVVAVEPSTTYWLMVANSSDPQMPYSLTICGGPS